jgi:hypothetical protein
MLSFSHADSLQQTTCLDICLNCRSQNTLLLTFPVLVEVHILPSLGEVASAESPNLEHETAPVNAVHSPASGNSTLSSFSSYLRRIYQRDH